MQNYVYIATSVDGYIADRTGGLDWLMSIEAPEGDDFGFSDFMDSIDALVMGNNTFEKVLSFGEWIYSKKVYVLSNSRKEISKHLVGKVEIVSGTPHEVIAHLEKAGHTKLYIDGGSTIQQFLNAGCIDELIITQVPIILGGGVPLFGLTDSEIHLELVKTTLLNKTLVQNHFRKK